MADIKFKDTYYVNLAYKNKTLVSFSIRAYSYEEFKDKLLEKISNVKISKDVRIVVTKIANDKDNIVADYLF